MLDSMTLDLERRAKIELELRRENSSLKTQEQGLTEQNRQLIAARDSVQAGILKMSTCSCPACQLARKYPNYGYINRVRKAIARGDHLD